MRLGTSSVTPARSVSHPPPRPPELDTLSFDSMDSLREQLHQVSQRLDEVEKEFVKSKEDLGESFKGGFLFVPKIQDKPILTNF
ncbi:hypothetical protein B296_00007838 [Ensete ventricosum]|uniref:Uncharacterized protein n=1 Tax=Ensete ventricosum TaxID=4639 RepID=A0A426ZV47_ENSVE|nr:hypothetical protein B296_00007838 [Ensete ventricosum]